MAQEDSPKVHLYGEHAQRTQQIIERFPGATVVMLTVLWVSLLIAVGASIWASTQTVSAQRVVIQSAQFRLKSEEVRQTADRAKLKAFTDLDKLSQRDLSAPAVSRYKDAP